MSGKAGPFRIVKVDEDERLVFGWASVSIRKDGSTVVDGENDTIDPGDLEAAVYLFNLEFRGLNERHRGTTKGRLVESLAVTPEKLEKMGLPPDALPIGWWAGWHIDDDAAWEKVKNHEYEMFSIEGTADRETL